MADVLQGGATGDISGLVGGGAQLDGKIQDGTRGVSIVTRNLGAPAIGNLPARP